MNLEDANRELGTALKRIPKLNVYDEIPSKVSVPCAFPALGEINYDEDYDGGMRVEFQIPVLVSRMSVKSAQKKLREFCAPDTTQSENSVKGAVELDPTLNGTVASIVVKRTEVPDKVELGGMEYVQVLFTAEAID